MIKKSNELEAQVKLLQAEMEAINQNVLRLAATVLMPPVEAMVDEPADDVKFGDVQSEALEA